MSVMVAWLGWVTWFASIRRKEMIAHKGAISHEGMIRHEWLIGHEGMIGPSDVFGCNSFISYPRRLKFSPYVHHTMGNGLDHYLPNFIKTRYVLQGSKVDLSDWYILDCDFFEISPWKFHDIIQLLFGGTWHMKRFH